MSLTTDPRITVALAALADIADELAAAREKLRAGVDRVRVDDALGSVQMQLEATLRTLSDR